MKKKYYGVIDVDLIPELKKPFIPVTIREEIKAAYENMYNYYNKYQLRKISKTERFNIFKKAYFRILWNGGSLPIAKVFLVNGEVKYEIIKKNLNKLRLTAEQAEIITITYLYRPILSKQYECLISIYNIDAFFHVLENEVSYNNEHSFVCGCYDYFESDFKKIEKIEDTQKRFLTDEKVHVFDDGVVLIYY